MMYTSSPPSVPSYTPSQKNGWHILPNDHLMCILLPTERDQWGHIHLYKLVCLLLPTDSSRVKHVLHQQHAAGTLTPPHGERPNGCALHWQLYQLVCVPLPADRGWWGHICCQLQLVCLLLCGEDKWNVFSTNICTSWYAYPFSQTGAKGDTFSTNSSWYSYILLPTDGPRGDTFFTISSWYVYPFLQTEAKGDTFTNSSLYAYVPFPQKMAEGDTFFTNNSWYAYPFPQKMAKGDTFFTNSSWCTPSCRQGPRGTRSSPPSIVAAGVYTPSRRWRPSGTDVVRSYTLEMKVFRCFNSSCFSMCASMWRLTFYGSKFGWFKPLHVNSFIECFPCSIQVVKKRRPSLPKSVPASPCSKHWKTQQNICCKPITRRLVDYLGRISRESSLCCVWRNSLPFSKQVLPVNNGSYHDWLKQCACLVFATFGMKFFSSLFRFFHMEKVSWWATK